MLKWYHHPYHTQSHYSLNSLVLGTRRCTRPSTCISQTIHSARSLTSDHTGQDQREYIMEWKMIIIFWSLYKLDGNYCIHFHHTVILTLWSKKLISSLFFLQNVNFFQPTTFGIPDPPLLFWTYLFKSNIDFKDSDKCILRILLIANICRFKTEHNVLIHKPTTYHATNTYPLLK